MPHPRARALVLGAALSFAFVPCAPAQSLSAQAPSQSPAQSQARVQQESLPIRDEAPLVVSGTQPGPGLWKVEKDGHVMWVLGTQAPLPKRMQWHSTEVEAALAASQEVLYAPTLGITVGTGFFKALFLLPKMHGARRNPDGKTLRDVLPPELHARWLPLRERYLGSGRGVERMRPLFAAGELWEEALDDNGLVSSGIILPVVQAAAKAHGLRETRPHRTLEIRDPKALLAEMEHASLDDTRCMEATLQRLEAGPARLRARANAWATGDIATLHALPGVDQNQACAQAAVQSPALRKRGGEGIDAEMERIWLDAAERALAGNASTFALLPVGNLLSGDGYLSKLAARGYAVTAPE